MSLLPGQPIALKPPFPQLGRGIYCRDSDNPRASLVGIPEYDGPVCSL